MKVSIPMPDGTFSIYTYNDDGEMIGHEISNKDINKESICPKCGEQVTLVGPQARPDICKKKKKKYFEFKECACEWADVVKEVRYRAFTHSSSFVGNVKYDQDEQRMEIILNGKTYDFCNVPERKFDAFEGADSKGAFFNREIKTLHDC